MNWGLLFNCYLFLVSKVKKQCLDCLVRIKLEKNPMMLFDPSASPPSFHCYYSIPSRQQGTGQAWPSCMVLSQDLHFSDGQWPRSHPWHFVLLHLLLVFHLPPGLINLPDQHHSDAPSSLQLCQLCPHPNFESLIFRLPAAILSPEPSSTHQQRQSS